MNKPLVEIRDLRMHFKLSSGSFRRKTRVVKAVDDVSFDILAGETLAVVGESGCGKSTITRALLRIYEPTAGSMVYHHKDGPVDLATLGEAELAPHRQDIRLVFQDPQGSLNPRLPVVDIIGEVLKVNGLASGKDLREKVAELMRRVGLRPETMHRYPHAFSGGERQRIGIARALACNPKLLIADEAVSALDVSVQAQTINLLKDLQAEFGLTYLFVSHDLSVVQHISDRIAVMYVGNLVEIASTDDMFERPLHPYTEALFSAVPVPDPDLRDASARVRLPGEVADPSNVPSGCPFHPRCRFATAVCASDKPPLIPKAEGRRAVACHHADDLELAGVFDTLRHTS
ncbi:oligopeptide/dipeptide ABC transporter ATP-binding protein [Marinovum sp.]|uniref:ABC transporter ATP-binding protein n=1 Tax=Marinovum sp. TaxID=2024839 RepID=UPI002B27A4BD|nr:oligopeptide/dipeptide ABC transporter ATP-binding protein [Marinovum sp.]